jgi:hypothetical protein
VTLKTRASGAARRSVTRMNCFSPAVLAGAAAVGVVLMAPHWRGLYAGAKVTAAVLLATVIAAAVGVVLIKTAERAERRVLRGEAGRLAAVSGAYAAELPAAVCKWQRPGSALERAEDDLSDAASSRAMSAPSRWPGPSSNFPYPWEQESAPFRAPPAVPAVGQARARQASHPAGAGCLTDDAGVAWHPLADYARILPPPAGTAPATDPITGAPIAYDERPGA